MFNRLKVNGAYRIPNQKPPTFVPNKNQGEKIQGLGPVIINSGVGNPGGPGPVINPGTGGNPGGPGPAINPGMGGNPGGPGPVINPGMGGNPGGPGPVINPGMGGNPGGPGPVINPGMGGNPGGPGPGMNPGMGGNPGGPGPGGPGGGQWQPHQKLHPCIGKFAYIWLNNGAEFWFFVENVTPRHLLGWRMRNGRWQNGRIAINRIDSFYCNRRD